MIYVSELVLHFPHKVCVLICFSNYHLHRQQMSRLAAVLVLTLALVASVSALSKLLLLLLLLLHLLQLHLHFLFSLWWRDMFGELRKQLPELPITRH